MPRSNPRTTARAGDLDGTGLGARPLAGDGLVGDVEGAIDDLEALGELLLGDAQRRVRMDRVVRSERVEVVVAEELADRLHLVGRAVVRGQRRPRIARPDEVDDPEQAEVADRA